MIRKPADLFDRDREWRDLVGAADAARQGVSVGVVYGRRRQGKSWMLRRLAAATSGIYHQALDESNTAALARVGDTLAAARGMVAGTVALRDWPEALAALTAREPGPGPRTRVAVIDELPYLMARAPELPSAVQRLVDDSKERAGPPVLLVLCGSAVSMMSTLLEAGRPLRGRARLELVVRPFDFRQARTFWGIRDPQVAFVLHAILGGTAGYRDLLDAPPSSLRGLAPWLARGLLSPAHALFREAEYVLAEDPRVTDRSLYHSILDAVSRGERTPSRIAGRMGRPEGALRHPLRLLEEAGFILREDDPLRQRKPAYSVADPIVRFQHLVIRPRLALLEERRALEAWRDAAEAFSAGVLGPHFEHLARVWTRSFASSATLGGAITDVGPTIVNDPRNRARIEVDVVARGGARGPGEVRTVRLIGEAKATARPRTTADLRRLERARDLIVATGHAKAGETRLALFARSGFSAELRREAARRPDVELIDIERLYEGS